MKSKAMFLVAALVAVSAASAAASDYTRKRAVYANIEQLRGQNAIALVGGLEKKAAHSKAWEAAVKTASKEFGEDHDCFKVAHFARSSWTSMVFASGASPSPQSISAVGTLAYQAGNFAATCYDEIEKLDAPTAKR